MNDDTTPARRHLAGWYIGTVNAAIGWEPTQSLDEILRDVIGFHQSEADAV